MGAGGIGGTIMACLGEMGVDIPERNRAFRQGKGVTRYDPLGRTPAAKGHGTTEKNGA